MRQLPADGDAAAAQSEGGQAPPSQKSESNNAITAGTQQLMFCADALSFDSDGWAQSRDVMRAGRERKLVK
jgi:hypothetical protein